MLTDYAVRIPPGGKTDALCETIITWDFREKSMKTRGLDSDQTVSAIIATQKMLNYICCGFTSNWPLWITVTNKQKMLHQAHITRIIISNLEFRNIFEFFG